MTLIFACCAIYSCNARRIPDKNKNIVVQEKHVLTSARPKALVHAYGIAHVPIVSNHSDERILIEKPDFLVGRPIVYDHYFAAKRS